MWVVVSSQTVVRYGLFILIKIKEAIIDGNDMEVGTELEWWREEKNYLGVGKVAKPPHGLHHKWHSEDRTRNFLHDGGRLVTNNTDTS
jgi:hypothetical protein